jgi:hypothetical protein
MAPDFDRTPELRVERLDGIGCIDHFAVR